MPGTSCKALQLRIRKDCQWYAARAVNGKVGWNNTRNQSLARRNPTIDDELPNRILRIQFSVSLIVRSLARPSGTRHT